MGGESTLAASCTGDAVSATGAGAASAAGSGLGASSATTGAGSGAATGGGGARFGFGFGFGATATGTGAGGGGSSVMVACNGRSSGGVPISTGHSDITKWTASDASSANRSPRRGHRWRGSTAKPGSATG